MNERKHTGADPYADLSKRTSGNRPKTGLMIIGATVAVVLVLVIVAVVLTTGGDDSSDAPAAVQEQSTVTVTGSPLPEYPQVSTVVAPPADDPAVGLTPPTLAGQDFAGSDLTIDPADGRAKVVIFVAHWCPHCQAEVPEIQKWIDEGNKPDNVDFYAVSTAVSADRGNYPPSEWLAAEGWSEDVLLDDPDQTAAMAYGLSGYPYFVMVDAEGKVTQRASGEVPIDQFGDLVDELSAASPS
jgi:cytochrome c biogenesis protein CcmG, thiol:disulfide interchange protein DsbE